jgi:hypothetical protein
LGGFFAGPMNFSVISMHDLFDSQPFAQAEAVSYWSGCAVRPHIEHAADTGIEGGLAL